MKFEAIDITGQKFNMLTAIKPTDQRQGNSIIWEFKCDCGNTAYYIPSQVKRGHTKSCGCKRYIKADKIIGQRFGRLVVKERCGTKKNEKGISRSVYLCECDCGGKCLVNKGNLTNGTTNSCGCIGNETRAKNGIVDCVEDTKLGSLNRKKSINNTSGTKGVCFEKSSGLWMAYISIKKKYIRLGRFKNIEDAIKARKNAEQEYFEPVLNKYGLELKEQD
jgi:hypothetical protein